MSMTVPEGIASRIEAVVLATEGVRNVYRAGSLVSNLVGEGAIALGVRGVDEPLVAVTLANHGARVEASLGIEYSGRATDVLEAVRAAITQALAAEALEAATIVLTIAYVHPREATPA